ncbi:MAG: sigma-70 family RNA polymerase sigma factor [Saprospiraceae bacterium]|jgi:RNA polymerase sigma factor (sigma-70 family)|nr:sigma-70 family RNA polymerase sigma factor [Saprospiraceae bacterium]
MSRSNFSNDSESHLWQDFLDNKPGSLETIYHQFAEVLFQYGDHFTNDSSVTEDCIQEVFATLHSKRNNLSHTTSIKYYLFKCLRLEIYRRLRKEQAYSRYQPDSLSFFDTEFSVENRIIHDEVTMIRVNQITNAVNQLPKRQKEAIYLRFYQGLSYSEIADIMETEQTSTYKIIYKAIASLYEKLASQTGKLFLLLNFLLT